MNGDFLNSEMVIQPKNKYAKMAIDQRAIQKQKVELEDPESQQEFS